MKYLTYTWGLVQALESAFPASWKAPVTSMDSIRPKINQEETKKYFKKSTSKQMVSFCFALATENPGLRELDLEASTKRDSDKSNRLRPRRKNTVGNKLYFTALIHNRKPST